MFVHFLHTDLKVLNRRLHSLLSSLFGLDFSSDISPILFPLTFMRQQLLVKRIHRRRHSDHAIALINQILMRFFFILMRIMMVSPLPFRQFFLDFILLILPPTPYTEQNETTTATQKCSYNRQQYQQQIERRCLRQGRQGDRRQKAGPIGQCTIHIAKSTLILVGSTIIYALQTSTTDCNRT